MLVRIVKKKFNNATVFIPQRRLRWLPIWVAIPSFYSSEFSDMPGWFTPYHTDMESALAVIESLPQRSPPPPDEVVYSAQVDQAPINKGVEK